MRERIAGFDEYLKKGQLEIIPHDVWYVNNETMGLDSVLADWIKKLETAINKGYAGMRASGNTHWLEKKAWNDFLEYEHKVNDTIGHRRITALCTYPFDRCGVDELLDVIGAHRFALIKRSGEWEAIENTDIKEARRAQLESELKFRYIFDQSPISAAIVSLGNRFRRVNEEMCRFTGYSSDELLGMKFTDITHPDDLNSSLENVKKLLEGSIDQFKMEKRYVRKDGTVVVGRASIRLVKDPSGKPLYFLPMIEDITEQKRAEEKLRQSETFLRNIFECIQDGISVLDKDLNILRVNPIMEKWYGREIVGKKCYQAYHKLREPCEACPSIRAFREKTTQKGIVHDYRGWSELYVFPLVNDKGEVTGVIEHVRDIDERKQAEDTLRNKQKELRTFVDSLPGYAFTKDKNGRTLMVNRKFCDDLGFSYDEPIGKTNYDLFPNDLAEKYTRDDERVFETGKPLFIEEEALVHGGRITVATRKIPLIDEKGRVTGLIGLGFDITELKRAERALKESEEKYRFLVENSKDVIWKMDLQGRWTFISSNVEKMTGYRPDEVVGKTVWDFLAPECHEFIKEKIRKRIDGEDIPPYEAWIINKDGRHTPFEVVTTSIVDKGGKVEGMQGISRDITLRRRAEDALRESEEKFRFVADFTYDWEMWAGPGDELYYISPSCERITGYRAEEFYEDPALLASIIMPEDRPMHMDHMKFHMASQAGLGRAIFRIQSRNGEIRWIEHQCQPVFGYKGEHLGRRISNRDITERKRSESELKSAKSQAELYLDLMSHDISNMNQVGMGFLELALDTLSLDENGRSIISRSMGALESSSRLIDKVRKLQKARSGELSSQEIDLGQTLSDVCAYYSRVLEGNSAICYEPVTGYKVMANELLYDVFSNIVDNAIKHSKDKPVINIKLEEVNECEQTLYKVSIEDNGGGVSDELKAQIFDRFQRGNTKAKGKGLGLYLAKTLVESYNGRVWVEDRVPGDHTKGSKFVVLLPALLSASDDRISDIIIS